MKNAVRDVLETLLLTVLIFLIVRSVVQNFKVEGRSMEPTLHNGQYLLINKAVYWRLDGDLLSKLNPGAEASTDPATQISHYLFSQPQRGDIIVFRYPKEPSRDFIKRVIGVPGDLVEIKNGIVYVNDKPLHEDYTADPPTYFQPPERVPEGQYFVLGDNRNNSSDSHVWGLVPEENIIGKAWFSYWPPDNWGTVEPQGPAVQSSAAATP
jgi:signal peptidase I